MKKKVTVHELERCAMDGATGDILIQFKVGQHSVILVCKEKWEFETIPPNVDNEVFWQLIFSWLLVGVEGAMKKAMAAEMALMQSGSKPN